MICLRPEQSRFNAYLRKSWRNLTRLLVLDSLPYIRSLVVIKIKELELYTSQLSLSGRYEIIVVAD